jgi:hypothetical protein
MTKILAFALAALTFMPLIADAQGKPPVVAKIDLVQVPAWVERGGVRASVKAGWAIYAGDRLFTGPEGRLQLALPGDGKLKLSGNAEIAFKDIGNATVGETPLFDVRGGVFQLSAPMVERPESPGTLITLNGKATANIRGGQVVGKEDALCLVDGAAVVSGAAQSSATMNQPQTVVSITPAGKVLAPIAMAGERLAQWVGSAQPVGSKPALHAEGTWDVSLNSGYNLKELESMACRIQKRGYPSEIYPVREPGKQVWYRVVVRRFGSKAEAVQFLGTARDLGAKEPWVLLPQG